MDRFKRLTRALEVLLCVRAGTDYECDPAKCPFRPSNARPVPRGLAALEPLRRELARLVDPPVQEIPLAQPGAEPAYEGLMWKLSPLLERVLECRDCLRGVTFLQVRIAQPA